MTDRERTLRIGSGDLIRWARMTAVGVRRRCYRVGVGRVPTSTRGLVPDPYHRPDCFGTIWRLASTFPRRVRPTHHREDRSPRQDEANRHRSSLAPHGDARPDHRNRHRAGRRSPLVIASGRGGRTQVATATTESESRSPDVAGRRSSSSRPGDLPPGLSFCARVRAWSASGPR